MAQRPTTLVRPRRGEVYLVNFDPILGAEIQETRPALIVQNDVANRHSAITIVAGYHVTIGSPPLFHRGSD
jgi:mRNA-degrading endonuclease toxin of MazEF toxin-antitoxin module